MLNKLLILIALVFVSSCSKDETPVLIPPVVEGMASLTKTDASVKSDNGNTIITLSYGELTQAEITVSKRITIMNTSDKERLVEVNVQDIEKTNVFSLNKNPQASTCIGLTTLKKYEKCTMTFVLNQNNLGTFVQFAYLGKLSIPLYANIQPVPALTCNDGYHVNPVENRCELDVITCPSSFFPEGANEAVQEWSYTEQKYLPENSCYIKTCNYLLYNTVYNTDGSVKCNIKKYNVNIINNNILGGTVIDNSNTPELTKIACGANCDHDYEIRSTVALVAQANPGFVFSKWEGSSCNNFSSTQCLISYINKDELIFAQFVERPPMIATFKNTNMNKVLNPNDTLSTSLVNLHFEVTGNDLNSVVFTDGGNCVSSNYVPYNGSGFDVTLTNLNVKKTYSVKFKNATLETACFNFSIGHDNTPPNMSFISPALNSYFGPVNGITLQGSCEAGLPVHFSGDLPSRSVPCVTGYYTENFITTFPSDGSKISVISQTDLAGNSTTNSYGFRYDGTGPSVPGSVNDHAQTYNKYATPIISYTASTDVNAITYEIAIGTANSVNDILDWVNVGTSLSSQLTLINPLELNKTYYASVRAKDSLGNLSNVATSVGFIYNNLWDLATSVEWIKPTVIKNGENFGDVIAYNAKYSDLFVKGKNSSGRDSVYVFSKNASGKYEQKQMLDYSYADIDGYGDSIESNGDFLYVAANLEDSKGIGYVNFNDMNDTGIITVYRKNSATSSWTYDSVIKSNSIGPNNRFGYKMQATNDGIFVLSVKDYNRGNDSTAIPATNGFLEFFKKSGSDWVLHEEYKVPPSNFVGSGKVYTYFYVNKPYVVLVQDNGSTTVPNTAYIYIHDPNNTTSPITLATTLGSFGGTRVGLPASLSTATEIERYQACVNYSLYKHHNRYSTMNIYQGNLYFRERTIRTDNSVTMDCNYVYNLSTGAITYQMDNSSSASYSEHIFKMFNNNLIRLYNTVANNKYVVAITGNNNFLKLNGESVTQTVMTQYLTNPSAEPATSISPDIFPNSPNQIILEENDLFIGTPKNDSCSKSTPFTTGCTDSGAILYIKRI